MKNLLYVLIAVCLISCKQKEYADFIVYGAKVYTVDSTFTVAESFAVKDGKIMATGSNDEVSSRFETQERINLEGKAVYPGLIDAHCHFFHYGLYMQKADLTGSKSFNEVLQKLIAYAEKNPGGWLIGRGWDQNDWEIKEYPDKKKLDSLFPQRPVFIERIDGHAALVNSEALKLGGITASTKMTGGKVEIRNGQTTGILVDNAVDHIKKAIPKPDLQTRIKSLKNAEADCFSVGLTTVDDAGLETDEIALIDSLQKTGDLRMRVYAMVSEKQETFDHYMKQGPYKTERLNVRSVKIYGDGALGSRGACLIQPYTDKPDENGFLLNSNEYYREKAKLLNEKGFQMNTHAIGDSAVKFILDVYGSVLGSKNDKRWRIEHAQVVTDQDLEKFLQYSVIPSVQPTHATSDMYWAEERLGPERIKKGYRYKELLTSRKIIAAGSDFPVEHINPLYGVYAAVSRKDLKGYPEQGFQPDNKLTREEALRAMTIMAAYSNFEEHEKGSLEPGKFADFVVLDEDLITCPEAKIPKARVIFTYVNGKKVFESGSR